MRFFEIHEPYYALLKAEDEEQAKKEYESAVAFIDEPNEIKEVEKDYALVKFSQTKDEDGNLLSLDEILDEFRGKERSVLLIDGALL